MSEVVRVAVALLAQNRLMREALTRILGRRSDIELVGSFGFSPTAVDEIAQVSADVLVMDWPGLASSKSCARFILRLRRSR